MPSRASNVHRVEFELYRKGPLTISSITALTGLSYNTVKRILSELKAHPVDQGAWPYKWKIDSDDNGSR